MARCFAVRCNNSQFLPCCLKIMDDLINQPPVDHYDSFGVGYYQDHTVFLRKKPSGDPLTCFNNSTSDIKSECLMGRILSGTVGHFQDENTQPFKFRHWLFSHTGTIQNFSDYHKLIFNSLPEHLQRNIKGNTDSELIFHTFLARIFKQINMEDHSPDPSLVANILNDTIEYIHEITGKNDKSILNLTVCNGRMIAASRHGGALFYSFVEGIERCDICNVDATAEQKPSTLAMAHKAFRAVLLASDVSSSLSQWIEVPQNSIIIIDRNLKVDIFPEN